MVGRVCCYLQEGAILIISSIYVMSFAFSLVFLFSSHLPTLLSFFSLSQGDNMKQPTKVEVLPAFI